MSNQNEMILKSILVQRELFRNANDEEQKREHFENMLALISVLEGIEGENESRKVAQFYLIKYVAQASLIKYVV